MQIVNERLKKSHIAERIRKLESGVGIDWATAEALAFGSLLYQGCIFISCIFTIDYIQM